jgi:hypothetical protein
MTAHGFSGKPVAWDIENECAAIFLLFMGLGKNDASTVRHIALKNVYT